MRFKHNPRGLVAPLVIGALCFVAYGKWTWLAVAIGYAVGYFDACWVRKDKAGE